MTQGAAGSRKTILELDDVDLEPQGVYYLAVRLPEGVRYVRLWGTIEERLAQHGVLYRLFIPLQVSGLSNTQPGYQLMPPSEQIVSVKDAIARAWKTSWSSE